MQKMKSGIIPELINSSLLVLVLLFSFSSCTKIEEYDLIINHATILDVETGQLIQNKTICIANGLIKTIIDHSKNSIADTIIDAKGKLVTPGFIDTHVHPISEFADGNYDKVLDTIPTDSILFYRNKLTAGFLPYGTTTILLMGNPDTWTPMFLNWTNNPKADQINVYTSGGALATKDGNTYKGHFRVSSPEEARQKVKSYHKQGVEHLKLYWRLKEPEFRAVFTTADSLGMTMFGHIGGFQDPTQLNVFQTLDIGLKNYEHAVILPCSVLQTEKDWADFDTQFEKQFGEIDSEPKLLLSILETFRYVDEHKKESFNELIDQMGKANCTLSTTIGFLNIQYQNTFFSQPKDTTLTSAQITRSEENFKIMMAYLKQMHDKGIELRIGTDTKDGGQILLLELMLLVKYGFSPEEAIKIATLNGAKVLGIENKKGTITTGEKADLIIWDKNPLLDPLHFKASKTILKDGIILKQ